MELDGNNWIIGNDGTNGTDWAKTIDGVHRIYGTLWKVDYYFGLEDMTELIELKEPLELVEWKEEITCTDGLVGINGNFKASGIDGIETL